MTNEQIVEQINKALKEVGFNLEVEIVGAKEPVKPEMPSPPAPTEPLYYLESISKALGISLVSLDHTVFILKGLYNNYRGALISILLYTIAKEIDLSYSGHISQSKVIYVYNTMDGKIYEQSTEKLKDVGFKYFAAFRCKEDAIFAITMANSIIKTYLMNDKQKN